MEDDLNEIENLVRVDLLVKVKAKRKQTIRVLGGLEVVYSKGVGGRKKNCDFKASLARQAISAINKVLDLSWSKK